jgi:hypothetical protein
MRSSNKESSVVVNFQRLEFGPRTDLVCTSYQPLNFNTGADSLSEWQVIDLALHAYQKVGVSLYDTLGKDAVG